MMESSLKCSWVSAIFSVTLVIFYSLEVVLTVVVFFITPGATS